MAMPRPRALRLEQGNLIIEWNDGLESCYTPEKLRRLCPCATCREGRASEKSDIAPGTSINVSLRAVEPVGNYGYKIAFSDGHDTGIFTLEYLYKLARET